MDSPLLASFILPAAIAVIMWSLGLTLSAEDFRRVLRAPRGILIGLVNLAVVSPLLALALADIFGLTPELAVGLVLLGASPGGMMANVMTHLSRGDTALSISMTAISSVGAVITVPFFLSVGAAHFGADGIGDVSMVGIVARIFAITVVPVAIGMEMRRRHPGWVTEHYPLAQKASMALFALVVIGAIASEYDVVAASFAEVAAAAITLNVAAMAISFGVSKAARLGDPQATAIALELGLHNSALAIAVGASLAPEVSVAAAVYATFMLFTGGSFAWAMGRRNAGATLAAPTPSEAPDGGAGR